MITLLVHAAHFTVVSISMLLISIITSVIAGGGISAVLTYFFTKKACKSKENKELTSLRNESIKRQLILRESAGVFVGNRLELENKLHTTTTVLQQHFSATLDIFDSEITLTNKANIDLQEVVKLLQGVSALVSSEVQPLMIDIHARMEDIGRATRELNETIDCARNTTIVLQTSIDEYAAMQTLFASNIQSYESEISRLTQELIAANSMANPNVTEIDQMERKLLEAKNEIREHLALIAALESKIPPIVNKMREMEQKEERKNITISALKTANHELISKIQLIGKNIVHNDTVANQPNVASTHSLTLFGKR